MTPDRVISVIKEAVFGGQDTSSNTLAFILYELSRNPSIADAVHAEIADLQGPITETNISQLKLVEAVIHETSRLYNVAPTAIRYLSEDVELPESGYVLRKGGFVFVLMCENHLRAGEWVDPTKFDPGRFLKEKKEVGPSGFGWNFAPFGYGVRKCPGESLALLEMKMVVAHLCKRYKFRLATDEPVKIKETFVRQCSDLPIILERREVISAQKRIAFTNLEADTTGSIPQQDVKPSEMFDWFAPQRKKDGPPIASNCHPLIGHYLAFTNPHGNIGLSSIIFKGLEHENVVEARLFGKTVYVARGPENVKAILGCSQLKQRTGGSDDVAADKLGMLHSGILFNSDIPSWRLHRKLLVHNIARPKFLAALIPRLNQYMNSIMPALDKLASSGKSVNVNDLGASIILDITMDVIFSEQTNAASNFIHECVTCTTNPATNKLIHIVRAFHNAQQYFMMNSPVVFNYITRKETLLHSETVARMESIKTLARSQTLEESCAYDSSEPEDFASTLLQGISDEITFDSIVSVIKEMILGGLDTTSNTLAYLINELAQNQPVADKIYAELMDVIGPDDDITEQHLAQLKYMEAAIFETSRFLYVVTIASRYLTQDLVLPETGYVLQRGSNVIALLSENHRNEAVWENASTFDPLRFMSDRNEGGPAGFGWNFTPFGYGVRKCPGQSLALLETKLILAHLCKHYQWRQESGNISDLSVIFEARS
ncbi:hypothetical protein HDU99_003263 [Rhizoclosmatium hyalinum]|nr:hypothetical protein HDU99_003263 [Rhizoclosmatium hyalinum]